VKPANLPAPAPHLRRLFRALAAACLIGAGLAAPAAAQTSFPVDQLMAPGALPDVPVGSQTAPVTIIEYASMTCTHCAAFEVETWPKLKAKYVDTGKVRYILREFPLDPLATAAFMLARCAGSDKRNALVDLLYAQQKSWAFVDKPIEALAAEVKQAGVSQADFEACLKNQDLLTKVNEIRSRASDAFKVDSTPTFFVNGVVLKGELPIEDFDKTIEPLLK
jgi:protein-disulfide isomerase